MAKNSKYQIAIIGPGAAAYDTILKRRIRKRLRELSPTLVSSVSFLAAAAVKGRHVKSPIVAVYFGGPHPSRADVQAVRALMATASVVLPVVKSLKQFKNDVPKQLRPINGMEVDDKDPHLDAITNLVLENLGLLRRSRRLFISYRRADSTAEALQIRHELDARGYDIFLDSHSVPKGDDFQQVLWQRLADSDVVVLLDSPGFMDSRWTREELAQAEAMTVGLIQVVWPGHVPARHTDLCERIYLKKSDFLSDPTGGLRKAVLEEIATRVEHLRARSLAARHDNLVREFCDAAASVNVPATVQPDRFVLAELPSGEKIAAIPAVGVPDAFRYHEASQRFPVGGARASQVFLIYDQRGLRQSWSAFLDWLDEFLPVKAVRVTLVAATLTKS